jgi:excisionase family DNA binding protein
VTGRLLTARQVADHLGVHVKTVLAWVGRGELPAIRLPGGAIRVRETDLDDWLDERATPRRGSVSHHAGRRPAGNGTLIGVSHHSDEEP